MATITRTTKNSASLGHTTRNSATLTRTTRSLSGSVLASAGLFRGFGAFTYIGGEVLITGSLPVITHTTKN